MLLPERLVRSFIERIWHVIKGWTEALRKAWAKRAGKIEFFMSVFTILLDRDEWGLRGGEGLKRWTVMNHLKNCTQEPCPGWGGLGMKASSYSVVLGSNQTTSPTTGSQLYREGPLPLLWAVKNLLEYLPWQKCFIPKKQSSAKWTSQ